MCNILERRVEAGYSISIMEITIESLKNISSEEQLKCIAPLSDLISAIEKEISPLSIHVTTYEELYEIVIVLKKHWNTFQDDVYFQSESARYIFALTHMEGKKRNEIIALTNELYGDEHKAKVWYKSVVKRIHPDVNQPNQEDAEKAMEKLNEIYDRIRACFNNDEED